MGVSSVGSGSLYAAGGFVSGPGTETSDSIPARLSNGEYVINARATAQNRALLDASNFGHARRFAEGGFVGSDRGDDPGDRIRRAAQLPPSQSSANSPGDRQAAKPLGVKTAASGSRSMRDRIGSRNC